MMKHTTLLFLAPVVLVLYAFEAPAQDVPTLDFGRLCRAEAKAAPDLGKSCLADEKRAHQELVRQWTNFASASRARCTQMATGIAEDQSYVELLTCLQMDRDVKSLPKE